MRGWGKVGGRRSELAPACWLSGCRALYFSIPGYGPEENLGESVVS